MAVIVTREFLLTLAVVAENVAEVALGGTVTDGGIVMAELFSERLTVAPASGAGWVRMTVQVAEESAPRLVRLHASEDIGTVATRLTLVVAKLLL